MLVNATLDNETLYELVIENGADDLDQVTDEQIEIVCQPKDVSNLKRVLEESEFRVEASEIVMEADNSISLDPEQSEKNMKLTDALEDLDDVQEVFTNADLDASVFE